MPKLPEHLSTAEVLDKIFKDPKTEFENLCHPIHEIMAIYPKVIASGRDTGKYDL